MPRQNRVTPFGDIVATPARGRWLGNRGCLHDAQGRIRRLYQTRRWIICVLEFKGARRALMQPGRWTELFFLDEATALAAGHRPCAYCQRARYEAFRAAWAAANPHLAPGSKPSADAMDLVLHAERLDSQRRRMTYPAALGTLPEAAFALYAGAAHVVRGGRLCPWRPEGYGPPVMLPATAEVSVLTPRLVVRVLQMGFAAQVDESANE